MHFTTTQALAKISDADRSFSTSLYLLCIEGVGAHGEEAGESFSYRVSSRAVAPPTVLPYAALLKPSDRLECGLGLSTAPHNQPEPKGGIQPRIIQGSLRPNGFDRNCDQSRGGTTVTHNSGRRRWTPTARARNQRWEGEIRISGCVRRRDLMQRGYGCSSSTHIPKGRGASLRTTLEEHSRRKSGWAEGKGKAAAAIQGSPSLYLPAMPVTRHPSGKLMESVISREAVEVSSAVEINYNKAVELHEAR
ncbi:hypothetical protein FB45DRAFT_874420 [Roridomyces roridus]|uniref:Uncharacterized protein n=1 Tax=Roridomyces roridus TaxID=1738132 RepID=A0AAD7B7Z2_9AGAR|nr:hypothetical protein FB45DRAFT_874420 [Roridomyces roridus]